MVLKMMKRKYFLFMLKVHFNSFLVWLIYRHISTKIAYYSEKLQDII